MKKNIAAFVLLSSTCLLQGCVPIVIGGAAVGSAIYLKKNKGFSGFYNDTDITNQALAKIKSDPNLQGTRISAATKDGTLLLTGQVPSPSQREEVAQQMQSVQGAKNIYNAVVVSGPISGLTQSSDDWITTKIKSELSLTTNFPSRNVKIVTENGEVYLLGTVTQQQGDIAANVARQVQGVQKVVKLFNYID